MYKLLIVGCLVLNSLGGNAQQLFDRNSEITLEIDKTNAPFFKMKLENDLSLSKLCKLLVVKEDVVRKYNQVTGKKIENKVINIPVSHETFVRTKSESLHKHGIYVPVKYTVKKGDTFYKLAKTYGDEDVETFMKRNKLEANDLKIGTEVIIAWLYIANKVPSGNVEKMLTKASDPKNITKSPSKIAAKETPENVKLVNSDAKTSLIKKVESVTIKPGSTALNKEGITANSKQILNKKPIDLTKELNSTVDTVYRDEAPMEEKFEWTNSKGIAYWQPSHRKSSGKYILHSSAPINSIVKLYNPMMRRSVDAKVIGRIPKENYRKDVDVVVSPAIAESLGALDSRFMVELTYKN